MKAKLFIENILIGNLELIISDEFMGVLSGELMPNENYNKFQKDIFNHFDKKGISNITDFNYRIILENDYELNPEGGIGIIHSRDYLNEIFVETSGNNIEEIKNFC